MEPIHIPRLTRAPEQTETIQFNGSVPGLETLTPAQGWIRVKHQGTYLEVTAQAEAIITLTCDRCLQHYNYRLAIAPAEMIWLDENAAAAEPVLLERDLMPEDLVESLSPQGYFDPATWLYEQFCLDMPLRQLCEQGCAGIELPSDPSSQSTIDRRWAGLAALKDQLSSQN